MIKNNIKYILVDKNMSARKLAELTGQDRSVIYGFVGMRRQSVQFDVLDSICRVLGVDVGDILQYIPDDKPPQ